MPVPRHSSLARAATSISATGRTSLASTTRRTLSTTTPKSSAHEDHYDPPSGWLWGIDPSKKPEKEGWEGVFLWGVYGSLGLAAVAYAFKPDTSIQTWALEEARRRLEVEGILKEPESK